MPKLILVRHSNSQVDPASSPHTWDLSPEGRVRAENLAEFVAAMHPASLHTSAEPKAMSTAEFISRTAGLAVNMDPGFNEHERSREPFDTADEFKKSVQEALRRPDELVYGSETISAAVARFGEAVRDAEKYCPPGDMAIVSHGTVISGFVAARAGVDPVEIWESIGMPGVVVITWPEADGVELMKSF